MSVTEQLQSYARKIRELRRANPDVPETALAPAFQQLIQGLMKLVPAAAGLVVMPEYHNPGVGRPDIALVRTGAPPRAFVELKAPAKSADPTRWRDHDKRQFERFRELSCWATCNFSSFHLFERAEPCGQAQIVPDHALSADRDDRRADKSIAEHESGPFIRLFERLCATASIEPAARDAAHLATILAYSARLVRGIVRDRLAELRERKVQQHALLTVRQEFRDVLYAHPEAAGYAAADFDELFSSAFAQTLAFGLLLVREATGAPVGPDAWQRMPEEHPLMRTALRVLSLDEVTKDIGVGFEVIRDSVNSFAPEILAYEPGGRDPILYFYEDFLETFDAAARERYGVYYTPIDVVDYMVAALDRVLRQNLGTRGLRDESVTILDPATGTGTFLLGIAQRVRTQAVAEAGAGMAALALQNLAGRMFGFELLVGPYAVAHYRLHHALRQSGPQGQLLPLPRLGVYLTDTLAEPGSAAPIGPLGFVSEGIADERREANRIKAEQPILAIIGNPPYRRLEEGENRTLVGNWLDGIWDDLKRPVRDAGQGNQLNTFPEMSVAFWRLAIWKLFEADNAPRRGVVAYITNRKFLTGWPYAGLRQMMREKFDPIEIIDLRGDVRRGERAGIERDQGVFNIRVGTAITLAIADGSKAPGATSTVTYYDTWAEGLFARQAKLAWLRDGADTGTRPNGVDVARSPLDDLRPMPFFNGGFLSISELFGFYRSGLQTKRDSFVYDPSRARLSDRIRAFLDADEPTARALFHETPDRSLSNARNVQFSDGHIRRVAYRPLDRRYIYNNRAYGDRLRPDLQLTWGSQNVCLYALPGGTGAGPAVWCHGLLPDYHAFRGSFGGYAFPLYDRRDGGNASNLSASLIESLSTAYGDAVAPEELFDAILCLLSATSYTLRFAEDLEDVFPHCAFPARLGIFREAARVGGEIRLVETFGREPAARYRRADLANLASQPKGSVTSQVYNGGAFALCADGSGRITGIPPEIWNFAVSGYTLLPRWIEGRVGLPADLGFVRELRDVCARIAELIDLMGEADIVLSETLKAPLSREALGLDLAEPEAE